MTYNAIRFIKCKDRLSKTTTNGCATPNVGLVPGTHLNLLSKTPNVTLSPDFRVMGAFSVKRWLLTNVPYLEVSFTIRV